MRTNVFRGVLLAILCGWPAFGAAQQPTGLAAITSFDQSPYLKLNTVGGGFSSTDPSDGNADYNNFRYVDSNGDKVMLDLNGPGTVYRIWVTGFVAADYIKIYLDGSATPAVNMLMSTFFSGTTAPFLAPLVNNDKNSSGGLYCYLPIPFAKSIRITTNAPSAGATTEHFYYNIGFHTYTPDTSITTWTGQEDSSAARALWNQAGIDPKSTSGNTVESSATDAASDASPTLETIIGPRSISSIKLHVPSGLDAPPAPVSDDGRGFTGYSQFTMALNSSNKGAVLTRRFDYGTGNQHASVYVDGAYVGEWITPGADDGTHRWRERSFSIPSSFTLNKTSVTIKIVFVSSDSEWNEYYYWLYSLVNDSYQLSDQLDVGNTTSEAAPHSYTIGSPTFWHTANLSYPQLAKVTDNGRANKGYSTFTMALNSANSGAVLVRRLDHSVGNQVANVYVNGALVGQWSTSGSNTVNQWLDSSFSIPSSFTAGKSSVTIKVAFASSDNDWNEFYYWMYSVVGQSNLLTDQLDVGNAVSEGSPHYYSDSSETWSGQHTYNYPGTNTVVDDGRAHKGYSQFRMQLSQANTGAVLRRRFDYSVGNQVANVYVNGALVGQWSTPGSDATNHWRDSSFNIPESFTVNQTSVTVKISFVSSAIDWNDFYFWMYSVVNGSNVLTDQLDAGNVASETAHNYTISTQTWVGQRTYNYPDFISTLNNTSLQMYWDNQSTASVNAPLGPLFAVGNLAAYSARSLAAGLDEANTLYLYFPMPFQSNAKIVLVNDTGSLVGGVNCEVAHQAFTDSFQNVGYFSTAYNTQTPTTTGNDIVILDTAGAGTFLGVTYNALNLVNNSKGYLEGDERILADSNPSPSYYGTGTEDFFNGAWYFALGPFTLPVHGFTAHLFSSSTDETSAYRFLLQDAVPFRSHIRVSIQHGGVDDVNVNAYTLAYYYLQSASRLTHTDSLTIGNTSSETSHHYSITGQTWSGAQTYTFEGEFDTTSSAHSGRAHKGTSQFTVTIPSSNGGIVLRRLYDQGIASQQAAVYVNNLFVGNWYRAGGNSGHRWREDDFQIPASFTNTGQTTLTITIKFVSSSQDWNEFVYDVYAKPASGG